jgi:hypothetical protein
MTDERMREIVEAAFALGGFGGNNFHGLGFLHAAQEQNIRPQMISCTSGQIDIVWKYLLANQNRLEERYGVNDLAGLAKVYLKEAEIRPKLPYFEVINDVPELIKASIKHLSDFRSFQDSPLGYFMNVSLNNLPARMLAPKIEEGTLEDIRDDFDNADIAIVFNSYDPTESLETVYLNPRAQALLNIPTARASSFRQTDHHLTRYAPITTEGLLSALWLYEYGFEERTAVDGAYFRMVMLSELSRARKIFVARPIQSRWTDDMPITYGEKEDLKTEISFNAAYLGERFRIELVNRCLERGAFTKEFIQREGYHPIKIYEVEPRTAQPFVTYFTENIEMFNEAYEEAKMVFSQADSVTPP